MHLSTALDPPVKITQAAAYLIKLLCHLRKCAPICSLLRFLLAEIIIHVLFGMHTEQIAAHGEGLAQGVTDNPIASHIEDICCQAGMCVLQKQCPDSCEQW